MDPNDLDHLGRLAVIFAETAGWKPGSGNHQIHRKPMGQWENHGKSIGKPTGKLEHMGTS